MAASLRVKNIRYLYKFPCHNCQRLLHSQTILLADSDVRTFGWPGSPSKLHEEYIEGEDFRVLRIPGHNQTKETSRNESLSRSLNKIQVPPAHFTKMKPDQDWTAVWPNAHMFKWSVVPLPVRQGVPLGEETGGLPNPKYANTELIKIPNFFHLTPPHIKKHCAAIKKFCTPWPEGLGTDEQVEKHFPIEVITREYMRDAPTHRDMRGRVVSVKFKVSSLNLDYHAKDKLLRLVGDRYNPKTDEIVLHVDRCPLRKQNYDYAMYLMTALFFESWKTEPWEAEKEIADMEKYFWDLMPSRKSLVQSLQMMAKYKNELDEPAEDVPESIRNLEETTSEETIVEKSSVQDYKMAVEGLHNDGEDMSTLNEYKQSVLKLLLGEKVLSKGTS